MYSSNQTIQHLEWTDSDLNGLRLVLNEWTRKGFDGALDRKNIKDGYISITTNNWVNGQLPFVIIELHKLDGGEGLIYGRNAEWVVQILTCHNIEGALPIKHGCVVGRNILSALEKALVEIGNDYPTKTTLVEISNNLSMLIDKSNDFNLAKIFTESLGKISTLFDSFSSKPVDSKTCSQEFESKVYPERRHRSDLESDWISTIDNIKADSNATGPALTNAAKPPSHINQLTELKAKIIAAKAFRTGCHIVKTHQSNSIIKVINETIETWVEIDDNLAEMCFLYLVAAEMCREDDPTNYRQRARDIGSRLRHNPYTYYCEIIEASTVCYNTGNFGKISDIPSEKIKERGVRIRGHGVEVVDVALIALDIHDDKLDPALSFMLYKVTLSDILSGYKFN